MQLHSCRKWLATTLCATLSFGLLAETAHSSTWNPTLLVNTEAFQIIHEGDSTTDIDLRFGDTVNEKLYWDRTNAEFRFSDDIRVDGNITASGTLIIGGATTLKSTLRVNGVTYTFPTSDGSATGKVLKTSGAGVLSWSTDANDGVSSITYANGQSYFVDDSGDSMTGGLLIQTKANGAAATIDAGLQLEVVGTASGDHLHAQGLLTASGAVRVSSGVTLNEDGDSNDVGIIFGSDTTNENLSWQNATDRFEFSDDLNATGNITGSGTLTVSGNAKTKGDLTINSDDGAADAILTFGNTTTAQTLKYLNTPQKFSFSKDMRVLGNLSGSTLNVDGNAGIYGALTVSGATTLKSTLKINSVTYTFPTSVGAASGQVLKTNTTGTLSWASMRGSGGISLHPEYPNTLYFGSGSNNVGTLALRVGSGSEAGQEIGNTYRWATTRTTNQNYWVQVRARLPDTFTGWEATPIQLRYRTMSGYIAGYMRDTANAAVALTGVSNIQNAAWTTASITGPGAAGTWTGGGYVTFLLRLTNSGASAGKEGRSFTDIGFLNFNVDTKLP